MEKFESRNRYIFTLKSNQIANGILRFQWSCGVMGSQTVSYYYITKLFGSVLRFRMREVNTDAENGPKIRLLRTDIGFDKDG